VEGVWHGGSEIVLELWCQKTLLLLMARTVGRVGGAVDESSPLLFTTIRRIGMTLFLLISELSIFSV